jgi:PAS domain S-box-containing protein
VILDAEGQVAVASPSVERVLGYALEDLLGAKLLARVHPEDHLLVKTRSRALLKGEAVSGLDVRIEAADGSWVPIRWSLALGPEGRIYGVGRDLRKEVRHREARLFQEMAELRLRTAMELHDGILQTLTGASFQIAVARRLVRQDPARAEEVLAALARSVSAEQKEMRLYVDEVKARSPSWAGEALDLERRIEDMLERASVIWGLAAVAHVRLPDGLSAETERRLVRITQEATVNAARHGGARSVNVSVGLDGRELVLEVSDDGHGFSFHGEFDDAALRARRLGPLSLKHRVAEAGGTLSIVSTPVGATLAVRIPLAEDDLP